MGAGAGEKCRGVDLHRLALLWKLASSGSSSNLQARWPGLLTMFLSSSSGCMVVSVCAGHREVGVGLASFPFFSPLSC